MSLNKQKHYRYGERKRDGVPDLGGNIRDYSGLRIQIKIKSILIGEEYIYVFH